MSLCHVDLFWETFKSIQDDDVPEPLDYSSDEDEADAVEEEEEEEEEEDDEDDVSGMTIMPGMAMMMRIRLYLRSDLQFSVGPKVLTYAT